jgi:hypothetical protein
MDAQAAEKKVEPHSILGKAIDYFLGLNGTPVRAGHCRAGRELWKQMPDPAKCLKFAGTLKNSIAAFKHARSNNIYVH